MRASDAVEVHDVPSTDTDRVDGGKTKYDYYPYDDRILVEQIDVDDTSEGGIIISVSKEKAFMGTVIKAGPGARNENGERIPMQVSEGDIVVFGKYAGMETQLNDSKLLVMKESDIIAIAVEKPDAAT